MTVIRSSNALSIHAPLVDTAFGVGSAVATVVHVEARAAFIAVSSDKVEGAAVKVSANARAKTNSFSFLASCKSRVDLHALTVPYSIAIVLATEAVSGD